MAMSWFTTLLRATPVFLRNIMWLNTWNVNKTIDFLEKSWIEQKFINETWLDKIVWANYSLFWWGAFDKRVKWFLWSMIIKNQLNWRIIADLRYTSGNPNYRDNWFGEWVFHRKD